jgi:putative ABC transport system substrate-binding protein
MRRREFIAGLGSAAAWPLAAHAQQPAMPVVGVLHSQSPELYVEAIAAFHRGLAETGYVEGKNVAVQYRWGEGQAEHTLALTGELVRNRYAVIVVFGSTPAALALKAATQTIPIVFQIGPDPVAAGLVASLNRPGGNLTGVTGFNVQVIAKRLELLHKAVPAATLVAFLVNPTNAALTQGELTEMQIAARALGLRLMVVNASTPTEIDTAFATVVTEQAGALVISGESFFSSRREQIVALAARNRVPTVYPLGTDAAAGGLMSYGRKNGLDVFRIVGTYAGRILKGEKPADLPVQQPSTFDFVINLMTAKALGLTIPETLLATADRVIE